MIELKHPSLEISWLPNSIRKGISTPRIFLLPADERFGGFYEHRTADRCISDWLDIDLKEGAAIALCDPTPGFLAHEYRHHWQIESGYVLGESMFSQSSVESYEQAIVSFFTSYWWEMDALRFQLKHAPDDCSLLWHELLVRG